MRTEPVVSAGIPFVGSLPELVCTPGGASFDPRADKWAYRDGLFCVCLDFNLLVGLSSSVTASSKTLLVWYAENHSPWHAQKFVSADPAPRAFSSNHKKLHRSSAFRASTSSTIAVRLTTGTIGI